MEVTIGKPLRYPRAALGSARSYLATGATAGCLLGVRAQGCMPPATPAELGGVYPIRLPTLTVSGSAVRAKRGWAALLSARPTFTHRRTPAAHGRDSIFHLLPVGHGRAASRQASSFCHKAG